MRARRRASTALAAADAGPVVVHRPARPVRRGRHDPGACSRRPACRTPGSGVAASALGMDKALFKRLCRGLGLPVVDWREVRARPLGRGSGRRPRRARGVRRGHRRPAADGQAGPASAARVGMTLAHEPGERAGGPRRGVPLRRPRPRRGLPRRRARPRGVGHRQRPGRLEIYGPGEIVSGHEFYDYAAKYTPGLSETSTRAEVDDAPARAHPQAVARRLPGDRRGGLRPHRLPRRRRADRRLRDQHDPGLHADQPVPDDARRGRLRLRRRLPADRRARPRARTPRRPAPPPAPRRPAAMTQRPGVRRTARRPPGRPTRPWHDAPMRRTPHGPARVGRADPGPRRGDARRCCCRPRPSTASPTRRRSRYAEPAPRGRDVHRRPRTSRRRSRRSRGANLFQLADGPAGGGVAELPTVREARRPGRACPDTLVGPARGARADPRLAGRGAALPGRRATGSCSPGSATSRRPRPRRCRSSRTGARPRPGCRSAAPDGRSTSTRRPDWPRSCPADVGSEADAPRASLVTDANGFVVRSRPDGWSADLRLLHAEPAHDRAHPGPGPPAAQPAPRPRAARRAGRSWPRETDGTYIPKPTPQADAHAEPSAGVARAGRRRVALPKPR